MALPLVKLLAFVSFIFISYVMHGQIYNTFVPYTQTKKPKIVKIRKSSPEAYSREQCFKTWNQPRVNSDSTITRTSLILMTWFTKKYKKYLNYNEKTLQCCSKCSVREV
jgi:hypothetical protein